METVISKNLVFPCFNPFADATPPKKAGLKIGAPPFKAALMEALSAARLG